MKKILIIVPSFNSGGTTTSLMNLVSSIDKRMFEIWIYPINNEGINKDYIAQYCNIIGYSSSKKQQPISLKQKLYSSIFKIVKSVKKFLGNHNIEIASFIFRFVALRLDKGNYDYVIAFQEGYPTQLCSYFKHGEKIAWVRAEYSRYLSLAKKRPEIKLYSKFNKIINVSKAAANNFIECMPEYKSKTYVLYNIINVDRILTMSKKNVDDIPQSPFIIVSIGRIDPVKRFSLIPSIAAELSSKGFVFKWIIIGGVADINEMGKLEQNIKEKQQENNIIILGQKANPYPYIKNSNLLVCLSSSETFNNTLTEAKILGIPVITTNFACAGESIQDDFHGYVTSIEEIPEKIAHMMTDKENYERIKSNVDNYHHNNKITINKLYSTILN